MYFLFFRHSNYIQVYYEIFCSVAREMSEGPEFETPEAMRSCVWRVHEIPRLLGRDGRWAEEANKLTDQLIWCMQQQETLAQRRQDKTDTQGCPLTFTCAIAHTRPSSYTYTWIIHTLKTLLWLVYLYLNVSGLALISESVHRIHLYSIMTIKQFCFI